MDGVSICSECKKGVIKDSDGLNCDLCKAVLHTVCAGLSRLEADCLKSKKRKISFFCSKCNLVDTFKSLKKEIERLSNEVIELKRKNADNKHTEFNIGNGDLAATEKIINEIEDRQKRSKNLIVYNVPELILENTENAENTDNRNADDLSKCKTVQQGLIDGSKIKQCIRLGKHNTDKTRPIKLVFDSQEDA